MRKRRLNCAILESESELVVLLDLYSSFPLAQHLGMSCSGIREALASCILQSDCVLRSDPPRTPQDCLKHHVDELPEECQLLRKSFFECKKGMVSRVSVLVTRANRSES